MSDIETGDNAPAVTVEGPGHDQWAAATPYVPPLLLETLGETAEGVDTRIDPLDGTLVFADISGFTALSERLAEMGKEGAERLTNIINSNFERMLDITRDHGGTNLKFGGDAMLLAFVGEQHAFRAVAASLAMQRAIGRFGLIRVGRDRVRLSMSVGVHSGRFWAAIAGDPARRMQHFVLGSEAGVLAETEGTASPGEVLITEATRALVEGSVATRPHADRFLAERLTKRRSRAAAPEVVAAGLSVDRLMPFLPPPVAHVLASGEGREATEAELRKVAIAFISLRGVYELVDEESPEALLEELQRYVGAVVRLADQHGGFLAGNDVDSGGLKLWVLFGAPVAHEDDAEQAARFAVTLNEEIDSLGLHLYHRIGLNTGFVFAGDLGSAIRRDYTVMGDPVNLSARLMAAAEPGQILMSEQIALEAGEGFETRSLPAITVKGKVAPIAIRELIAEQELVATSADRRGALFGREHEMSELRRVAAEVEAGSGRSVLITAGAGTGKSRLVAELEAELRDRGWRVLRGHGYAHTTATPFHPWVQLLTSFLQIDARESLSARSAAVLSTVERLVPEMRDLASLLDALLGLAIEESDIVRSLDDESRRQRLFDLITALLRAASEEAPIALLLEDLHWADRSSLELTEYVAAGLADFPAMLCVAQRPAEEFELRFPPASTLELALDQLSGDAAFELLAEILGRRDLPPELVQTIFERCQGNPLFLEEVARSLRESSAIEELLSTPPTQLSEAIATLELPDRLQSLMMSRIDALQPVAKQVLRFASVVGATFARTTVQMLLQSEPSSNGGDAQRGGAIDGALSRLMESEFLVSEPDPTEVRYRFRHVMIRDVAYDSMLFSRRRQLHHRVASHMEATVSEEEAANVEALAHHYGRSGDAPKTVHYSALAGDRARTVFASDEAIGYYEASLQALEDVRGRVGAERSYLRERIGDCYDSTGRYADAQRAFSSALRGWRSAGRGLATDGAGALDLSDGEPRRIREASLGRKIAVQFERTSNYDASLRWSRSALEALPPRQPRLAAQILGARSMALFRKGRYEDAISSGREALTLARRSGDRQQLALAHNILATSYVEQGKLKQSVRHRVASVRLYEEAEDLYGLIAAESNLGVSYEALGRLDEAHEHYSAALDAAERIGNRTWAAIAHNNIGEVLLTQGRVDEAIAEFEQTVATYEQTGDPAVVAGQALVHLSRAEQRRQRLAQAAERLEAGARILRETGARGVTPLADLQEAELALESGSIESAQRACQRALTDARATGMQVIEARALRLVGRVAMARERGEEAEAPLRESVALAHRVGAQYEKGQALLNLAELYASRPEEKGARRRRELALRRAITIFERLGASHDLARARVIEAR